MTRIDNSRFLLTWDYVEHDLTVNSTMLTKAIKTKYPTDVDMLLIAEAANVNHRTATIVTSKGMKDGGIRYEFYKGNELFGNCECRFADATPLAIDQELSDLLEAYKHLGSLVKSLSDFKWIIEDNLIKMAQRCGIPNKHSDKIIERLINEGIITGNHHYDDQFTAYQLNKSQINKFLA